MLVIRPEQNEAFRQAALARFEKQMVNHCRSVAPRFCESLDESSLRTAVRRGIKNAGRYGFVENGPVRFYIELTLQFGGAFDSDPQYPWIREILTEDDSNAASQMPRAMNLYEKTTDYFDRVEGEDDSYALEATKRVSWMVRQPDGYLRDILASGMIAQHVHPRKASFTGAVALENLYVKSMDSAAACRMTSERGRILIFLLMFTLGHGCLEDPLYPWIGDILGDRENGGPDECVRRLAERASAWFDKKIVSLA